MIDQTYRSLEILIVDDGSTDSCGTICDEYAVQDNRITVFHTDNHGLSAARNYALDRANGKFIAFIDSDDWISPDLLENALASINDADILCYSNHFAEYLGLDGLIALTNGNISTRTWDKLYRKECFEIVRFPEGRIMEDIATTYRLIHQAKKVACADCRDGYHYRYREDSLAHTHNMKNILDYCRAVDEQYDYCMKVFTESQSELSEGQIEKIRINLLKFRGYAIARAWGWRNEIYQSDSAAWARLSHEASVMFPYRVRKHFPLRIRGGLFLARFNHPLSFWIANKIHIITRSRYLPKSKL